MFFFKRKKKDVPAKATAAQPAANPRFPVGAAVSDVGCARTNNEDNFLLGGQINLDRSDRCKAHSRSESGQWYFTGVFDGMGGGEIGEVAAQTAAEIFRDTAGQLKNEPDRTRIDSRMRRAFLDANNKIVTLKQQYQIYGTTGTVLCTDGQVYKIYHLGDSRAYLLRDQALFQLTRDQTLAQMKIDVGLYQPGDPQAEAEKHKLTEYIGKDQTKAHLRPLESEWLTVLPGDCILLCSDGLCDMCTDCEITELLTQHSQPGEQANALVQAALSHGGIDNVTCICLQFPNHNT